MKYWLWYPNGLIWLSMSHWLWSCIPHSLFKDSHCKLQKSLISSRVSRAYERSRGGSQSLAIFMVTEGSFQPVTVALKVACYRLRSLRRSMITIDANDHRQSSCLLCTMPYGHDKHVTQVQDAVIMSNVLTLLLHWPLWHILMQHYKLPWHTIVIVIGLCHRPVPSAADRSCSLAVILATYLRMSLFLQQLHWHCCWKS